MVTSRALTGSSAMTSLGRVMTAEAMETRWRWPPESSLGSLSAYSGPKPTWVRIAFTAALRSLFGSFVWIFRGSSRIQPTVFTGFKLLKGS